MDAWLELAEVEAQATSNNNARADITDLILKSLGPDCYEYVVPYARRTRFWPAITFTTPVPPYIVVMAGLAICRSPGPRDSAVFAPWDKPNQRLS